jgi:hypothetical protein
VTASSGRLLMLVILQQLLTQPDVTWRHAVLHLLRARTNCLIIRLLVGIELQIPILEVLEQCDKLLLPYQLGDRQAGVSALHVFQRSHQTAD